MSAKEKISYRLDRVLLVGLVLLGCSSGMIALVAAPDELTEPPARLTFPEPLEKVQGYDVPSKELATSTTTLHTTPSPSPYVSTEHENVPLGSLLPCSCCKKTIRIPRNPYTRHQAAARNLPNSFYIKNESDVRYGLGVKKLVKVTDGQGYRIDRLRYSKAMLLPEARDLLEEMGLDYAEALKGTDSEGTVFRVTSMTRTDEQQRKLTRRNRNATRGESTHSYGASFDIAFMDRLNEKGNCSRPTREIQKLLLSYQKEGRILIIPEGGCMHITLLR